MKKKKWTDNIKYEHLVAGLSGGVFSTIILHPFDLIKIRFQVNDGSLIQHRQIYNGVVNAFRTIIAKDGIAGLYQGVTPNLAGGASSWGLYFFAFSFFKESLKDWKEIEVLPASDHLSAAGLAGVSTLAATNPIWVVKTRMCLQPSVYSATHNPEYYNGIIDGLRKLYKNEGIKGYYRGFLPGILGCTHGALQFMAYEELKKKHSNYTGSQLGAKLNPLEYIAMAALSKIFAVITTYPYQVIRSRLQDSQLQEKYNGAVDIFRKIYRNEGISGYYKGLAPCLLRVTPACCITFLVYENIIHFLLPVKTVELS